MDSTFLITAAISGITAIVFYVFQLSLFVKTSYDQRRFKRFFRRKSDYEIELLGDMRDSYPQIIPAGKAGSDLNALIGEINIYLEKTKGTSDYEFIRNKVERKLNMLRDRSTTYLAFPTYLGLMGTFVGVFIGIFMFLSGFDDVGNISDESIKNLLTGILVSMSTSFFGLLLTTINNGRAGKARKVVEDDKNDFFDFIQTEVTKTASASLVYAISKLHDTVDKFEPSFSTVIDGFKTAFNDCTRAFGDDFKRNVSAVTSAVEVMGGNIDKINKNIDLQQRVLDTIKSKDLVSGMDKYIQAAALLEGTAKSLGKFEEARKMMLAATQEAIAIQNQYIDSLRVPRDIAIQLNQILNRITEFEKNVNDVGRALNQREILGDDVVVAIKNKIDAISRKSRIADRFLDLSDEALEKLYGEQTAVIDGMNNRYRKAIAGHIEGFEGLLTSLTKELKDRHKEFMKSMEENLSVESVRQEFTNLRKLESIERTVISLVSTSVKPEDVKNGVMELQENVNSIKNEIKPQLESISNNTKSLAGSESRSRRSWFRKRKAD